jgi:hypothetical protein
MRRLCFILLAPTVIAPAVAFTALPMAIAEMSMAMAPQPEKEKKCIKIGGKRICLEDFKKGKDEDEDEDDDKPKKTGNICEGDNECPPGYIDLETPNKYKA